MLRERILLPPGTMIETGIDPYGTGTDDWFVVSGPGFMLEGWAGMPEEDVRAFIGEHVDREDMEQLLASLRQDRLVT